MHSNAHCVCPICSENRFVTIYFFFGARLWHPKSVFMDHSRVSPCSSMPYSRCSDRPNNIIYYNRIRNLMTSCFVSSRVQWVFSNQKRWNLEMCQWFWHTKALTSCSLHSRFEKKRFSLPTFILFILKTTAKQWHVKTILCIWQDFHIYNGIFRDGWRKLLHCGQ
jgi:hypothetical protein